MLPSSSATRSRCAVASSRWAASSSRWAASSSRCAVRSSRSPACRSCSSASRRSCSVFAACASASVARIRSSSSRAPASSSPSRSSSRWCSPCASQVSCGPRQEWTRTARLRRAAGRAPRPPEPISASLSSEEASSSRSRSRCTASSSRRAVSSSRFRPNAVPLPRRASSAPARALSVRCRARPASGSALRCGWPRSRRVRSAGARARRSWSRSSWSRVSSSPCPVAASARAVCRCPISAEVSSCFACKIRQVLVRAARTTCRRDAFQSRHLSLQPVLFGARLVRGLGERSFESLDLRAELFQLCGVCFGRCAVETSSSASTSASSSAFSGSPVLSSAYRLAAPLRAFGSSTSSTSRPNLRRRSSSTASASARPLSSPKPPRRDLVFDNGLVLDGLCSTIPAQRRLPSPARRRLPPLRRRVWHPPAPAERRRRGEPELGQTGVGFRCFGVVFGLSRHGGRAQTHIRSSVRHRSASRVRARLRRPRRSQAPR